MKRRSNRVSFIDFQPLQQEVLELREKVETLTRENKSLRSSLDETTDILNIIESRVNVDEILRDHAAWTRERAEWEQEQT